MQNAGDAPGVVAHQVERCAGNVFRTENLARRHPRQSGSNARLALRPVTKVLAQHRRIGDARTNAIHADVIAPQIESQRFGQQRNGALGSAVGRRPQLAHKARRGTGIENRAAPPAPHVRRRMLDGQKRALHVHRHHPVPVLFGRLFYGLYLHNAGIVEQDIDASPARNGELNHVLHIRLAGHIGARESSLVARRAYGRNRGLAARLVRIHRQHLGALRGKCNRTGSANAARGPRHNRDSSFKLHPVALTLLSRRFNATPRHLSGTESRIHNPPVRLAAGIYPDHRHVFAGKIQKTMRQSLGDKCCVASAQFIPPALNQANRPAGHNGDRLVKVVNVAGKGSARLKSPDAAANPHRTVTPRKKIQKKRVL